MQIPECIVSAPVQVTDGLTGARHEMRYAVFASEDGGISTVESP